MPNTPNSSEHNDVDNGLDSVKLDSSKLHSVDIADNQVNAVEAVEGEVPVAGTGSYQSTDSNPIDHTPKAAHVTLGNSMTPMSKLVKTPKMIANGSRAVIWYLLSLFVLIIDQGTKWLAETNLTFNEPVPVIEPFLNWTLAYNYGAAFSFLADAGGWQKWFFSGLALVMSIFLTVYLIKAPRKAKLLSFGLALVLGGAVGNLIDRLLHGHVIDFIHVHNADVWHYPIFNIADMGISIGVALIVIDMLFLEKKRQS